MIRCTLIGSGGAQVFLIGGQARFSTTDHTSPINPSSRRVLRDLQGGAPVAIHLGSGLLRRKSRLTFADGTVWTLTPTGTQDWRAEIDDGTVTATLSLDFSQRIQVLADGRQLAVGIPLSAQMISDQQWTLEIADDVDLPWLAAAVAAMLLS